MPKIKTLNSNMQHLRNQVLNQTYHLFNCPIVRKVYEEMQMPNFYKCTVCEILVSGNMNLQEHIQGKKHTKNYFNLKESTIMAEVLKFRETNEPVLGLEYIAELGNSPYESDVFYCVLCRVRGFTIIDHLDSSEHTEKYLENHFPTSFSIIQKYLKSHKKVKLEFYKLVRFIISQYADFFALKLPTVCFYKEFHCEPREAYKRMQEKAHLKETPKVIMRVIKDLRDVVKDLEDFAEALGENSNAIQRGQNDDRSVEIDTSNLRSQDREMIKNYLKATDDFFKNLDKRELDKLKMNVSNAARVNIKSEPIDDDPIVREKEVQPLMEDPIFENCKEEEMDVQPLTNDELELLMINFQSLDKDKQQGLFKVLNNIRQTDPERFELLRSVF